MNHHRFLGGLLVCGLASLCLFGQSDNGSITGFAKDSSGAFVPNARVAVKNEETGLERRTITNESGYYAIPNLLPGYYTVTAEAVGFRRFETTGRKLDPNSTLAVDTNLQIGSPTDTVEVTASAQGLQTESAALEKLVTRTQIDSLELNGRNPLYMTSLQPGIRSNTTLGDFNFSLGNGRYAVNGARVNDTQITFDGAPAFRTREIRPALAWRMWIPLRKFRSSPATTMRNMDGRRRADPRCDQRRRAAVSWRCVRVFPELRAERQCLDSKSKHHD